MADDILSAEQVRLLFEYDPESGRLAWRVPPRCWPKSRTDLGAGGLNKHGYLKVRYQQHTFAVHRLVWLYVHGAWPVGQIDHINGLRSDNRIGNLRDVPSQTNRENQRRSHGDNRTGFLGVSKNHAGFRATIQVGGVRRGLGTFPTAEQAHKAYVEAKRALHEGGTL